MAQAARVDAAIAQPGARGVERQVGAQRARQVTETRVRCPLLGIRSTDLRRRVAEGRSIRYLTPAAVERYIAAHRLYASPG